MTTPPVTTLLRQFAARHRRALATRASVLAVLSLAIAGAIGWRLHLTAMPPVWWAGVPAVICAAALGALTWWLRQRWPSSSASAEMLDRQLGLQQRLVTAAEFAATPDRSPLYPVLLKEIAEQIRPGRGAGHGTVRAPRTLDRTIVALAVLLLLVWLWPIAGRSPLQQLAKLVQPTPPPPTPDPSTPPPTPQDQQKQDQQQQQGGGGSQEQQPSGGSKSQDQSQSGGGQQPDQKQGQGSSQQQQGQAQQQQAGQQGQQAQQQQGGQGGQKEQAKAGDSQGKQDGAKPSPGSAQEMTAGDQAAMKAEIQELLKEVSGELKNLQEQLEAAEQQGEPPPNPGSATDPDLYEKPEQFDPSTGEAVPIQLKTDDAPTKTPRPGSGTGKPLGEEISDDGPQSRREEADLSDTPAEESGTGRQAIPPEYRDVFDRLNRTPTQTSEGAR